MNKQEIEKAAKDMAHERKSFPIDYYDGFYDAVEWILDKSAQGFEEWFDPNEFYAKSSRYQCEKAWQACAISKDREIEELRKAKEIHHDNWYSEARRLSALESKYDDALKDLDWVLKCSENNWNSGTASQFVTIRMQLKEIRKRHGLEGV